MTIKEHYTDTAGYTDQVFGLTHLLGFRFAPRLRDLADSKLYSIGKASDFPKLEKLLRGQINTKVIQENYDDVLRLAHSIREGTVSASLIMGKLGSYARQNRLAIALREMGRIEKTIWITFLVRHYVAGLKWNQKSINNMMYIQKVNREKERSFSLETWCAIISQCRHRQDSYKH